MTKTSHDESHCATKTSHDENVARRVTLRIKSQIPSQVELRIKFIERRHATRATSRDTRFEAPRRATRDRISALKNRRKRRPPETSHDENVARRKRRTTKPSHDENVARRVTLRNENVARRKRRTTRHVANKVANALAKEIANKIY